MTSTNKNTNGLISRVVNVGLACPRIIPLALCGFCSRQKSSLVISACDTNNRRRKTYLIFFSNYIRVRAFNIIAGLHLQYVVYHSVLLTVTFKREFYQKYLLLRRSSYNCCAVYSLTYIYICIIYTYV